MDLDLLPKVERDDLFPSHRVIPVGWPNGLQNKYFERRFAMDEKLQAMLVRSGMFSPYGYTLPLEVRVESFPEYNFFLPGCFCDQDELMEIGYFRGGLKNLLFRYINAWAGMAEQDPKMKFSWKEHCKKVFDFYGDYKWKEVLLSVKSGKNSHEIPVGANGSKLKIKRFGNILAFDILNASSERKEHTLGTKAILSLCRAEDHHNNQGVYELFHKVKVCLELGSKNVQHNEHLFDFSKTFEVLEKEFYMAKLDLVARKLVDQYKTRKDGIFVGKLYGFDIFARLIHMKEDHLNGNYSWRKGNVEHESSGTEYRFKDAEGLRLELMMRTGLPDKFLEDVEAEKDCHDEQFKFSEVASLLVAKLCSMQQNLRLCRTV